MKKYTINDFFAGKVDIRCKNDKQKMAVLNECEKRGIVWNTYQKGTSILPLMPVLAMDFFGNGRLTQSNGHDERNVVDFDQIDFCPCKTSYQILIDCDGTTTTATMTINDREIKTAIARRNPADEFDWRKGSALAFERLWNSPKKLEEKPEVREVKRWAKPGEYIKFSSVHGDCERYKNGDILKVESVIEVCGEDGFTQIACCGVIATPDEYVVLEGYRP